MTMGPLRLLADDLTGALDSAAAFGADERPVPVLWQAGSLPAGAFAFDSGTREAAAPEATATAGRLAPRLFARPDALAYKKVDSLLRGSEVEEIDAILKARPFGRCVVAPAFPAQGRVTRGGRQGLLRPDGGWEALDQDVAARLEGLGFRVARRGPGDPVPQGLSVFDAESDADLDALAASAPDLDDTLWVGSGGLAAALARRAAPSPAATPVRSASRPGPLLGLFGTDHPVMRGQLAGVDTHHLAIGEPDAAAVEHRLRTQGAAFVSVVLPPQTSRADAAARIALVLGDLVGGLDAPGTLVVAGGETLRGLCGVLGAERLDVVGEVMPGIPRSVLMGGRWSGVHVVSKSGAFGAPDLLRTLLAAAAAPPDGACQP